MQNFPYASMRQSPCLFTGHIFTFPQFLNQILHRISCHLCGAPSPGTPPSTGPVKFF